MWCLGALVVNCAISKCRCLDDAIISGYHGAGPDAPAAGRLRHAHPGRPGRRGAEDRGAWPRRLSARLPAARQNPEHLIHRAQSRQAQPDAEPQDAGRPQNLARSGVPRRCADRELSSRRAGAARARLPDAAGCERAADRLLDQRLRPILAAGRARRPRPELPGLRRRAAVVRAARRRPAGRAAHAGCRGPLFGGAACYSIYPTADGRALTVAAVEPHFWANLCTILDREEYIALQYADWAVQERMFVDLDALFAAHTLAEWLDFFGDVEVCVGPVLGLAEALELHSKLGFTLDQPGEGLLRQLGGLFGATADLPAPALGEHTDAALAALGLSAAEIVGLRVTGAV